MKDEEQGGPAPSDFWPTSVPERFRGYSSLRELVKAGLQDESPYKALFEVIAVAMMHDDEYLGARAFLLETRAEGFWWARPKGERWRVVEVTSAFAVLANAKHVLDASAREPYDDYDFRVEWGPYLGTEPGRG